MWNYKNSDLSAMLRITMGPDHLLLIQINSNEHYLKKYVLVCIKSFCVKCIETKINFSSGQFFYKRKKFRPWFGKLVNRWFCPQVVNMEANDLLGLYWIDNESRRSGPWYYNVFITENSFFIQTLHSFNATV